MTHALLMQCSLSCISEFAEHTQIFCPHQVTSFWCAGNRAATQNPSNAAASQLQLASAVPSLLAVAAAEQQERKQDNDKFITMFAEAIFWVAWYRASEGPRLASLQDPSQRSWTAEMRNSCLHKVVYVDILQDYTALFDQMRSRSLGDKYEIDISLMSAHPSNVAEGVYTHAQSFMEAIQSLDKHILCNVIPQPPTVRLKLSWPDAKLGLTY